MAKIIRRERAEILADHKWWKELEKYLPWHLHGFTGRVVADFITEPIHHSGDRLYNAVVLPRIRHKSFLTLQGHQRDQILEAIQKSQIQSGR